MCWYQKKLVPQPEEIKNWFLGVPEGGGTPKPRQSIRLLNIYWYQKTPAP